MAACAALLASGPRVATAASAAAEPRRTSTPLPRPVVLLRYANDQTAPLLLEGRTRLVAELRVAGFEVELGRPDDDPEAAAPSSDELAEPAPPPSFYAELRLSAAGDQLKVELSNRANGTSNQLVVVGKRHEVAAVALQSVEFLRAGLVPRPIAAPPPAPASPRSKDVGTSATSPGEPRRAWGLELGAALLTSWAAGDRLGLLTLRPSFALSERVAVAAAFGVPLNQARFQAARGDATYRVWLSSVSVDYTWLRVGNAAASLGGAAGLARVSSAGAPDAPLLARESAAWSVTLGVRGAFEYRVAEGFACVADAQFMSFSPNPVITVLDAERRLGAPSVMLGLGARLLR